MAEPAIANSSINAYFVIYVTVRLQHCEFDTSPLELIGKQLASTPGVGGAAAWQHVDAFVSSSKKR